MDVSRIPPTSTLWERLAGRPKRRRRFRGGTGSLSQHRMGFMDRVRVVMRALMIRMALLLAGCAALIISLQINENAGTQILAGLFRPDSPSAIVISIARLATPALGLWLVYRGLR